MKRLFRGTVAYKRMTRKHLKGFVGLDCVGGTTPALVFDDDFLQILGVRCGWRARGELDLRLRLIGSPLPWDDWIWSDGEAYQPNRLVVENSQSDLGEVGFARFAADDDNYHFTANGRCPVADCCVDEIEKIFPGLAKAIGSGNACEVEITVEKQRADRASGRPSDTPTEQ